MSASIWRAILSLWTWLFGPKTRTPPAFIETRSGRRFQPLEPIVADIDIEDIAHALSNQCRFSGHVRRHYSVAEHCVRVAQLLARWGQPVGVQRWGVLHDAAEYALVDLPQPLKRHPDFEPYRRAEARLMLAICERFGLDPIEPEIVRKADRVLLATEARDLMPFRPEHWQQQLTEAPLEYTIYPWSPEYARRVFLETFHHLEAQR